LKHFSPRNILHYTSHQKATNPLTTNRTKNKPEQQQSKQPLKTNKKGTMFPENLNSVLVINLEKKSKPG
jgi:hypothetical protein